MSKKRYSNFGYYLKEGITGIFTRGFMSFASVVIIISSLLIMGSFLLIALNINEVIGNMEDQNQIVAFVDEFLSDNEARALEQQVNNTENVAASSFVTREQAWMEFVNSHETDRFDDRMDATALRHRFVIDMEDIAEIDNTLRGLREIEGIANAQADVHVVNQLVALRNVLSVVFISIIAVLFIISLFIISNTIKLATFDRREEIAIMRMVGATKAFIRLPFMFQGFILGLFAASVAFLLQWALYNVIADRIMEFLPGEMFRLFSFSYASNLILVVFLGTGFVVGTLGSVLTIRKYLKV